MSAQEFESSCRRIQLGIDTLLAGHDEDFPSNYISTTKYKLWNIVPKNLWEQFHRMANIWFLVVSIFQMLPLDISPTNKIATLVPLCCVLFITFLKDAAEDMRRWKDDLRINNQPCQRVNLLPGDNTLEKVRWRDLTVGSYVRLVQDEPVPADLVLLSSSHLDGMVYVDTAQLDGETSLKPKMAVDATLHMVNTMELQAIRGHLDTELPNEHVQSFKGVFHLQGVPRGIPVDIKNVILRGSTLRNTTWAFGMVVYTGPDTKLVRNSQLARRTKRSQVEVTANRLLIIVFALLTAVAAVSAAVKAAHDSQPRGVVQVQWVYPKDTTSRSTPILDFLTFMIGYNNLIPISLYMTTDLVRALQASLMERDKSMYHAETQTFCKVRNSGLCEDLGQVEFILSDKTGTLTQNVMRWKACYINGSVYGYWDEEKGKPVEHLASVPPPTVCRALNPRFFEACAVAARLQVNRRSVEEMMNLEDDVVNQFFLCLALCHTARPELVGARATRSPSRIVGGSQSDASAIHASSLHGSSDGAPRVQVPDPFVEGLSAQEKESRTLLLDEAKATVFRSLSPDEEALLAIARDFGFFFRRRLGNKVYVNVRGQDRCYQVFLCNEFTSERKRMSILVRQDRTEEDDEERRSSGSNSGSSEQLQGGSSSTQQSGLSAFSGEPSNAPALPVSIPSMGSLPSFVDSSYILFAKGADSVMLNRLAPENRPLPADWAVSVSNDSIGSEVGPLGGPEVEGDSDNDEDVRRHDHMAAIASRSYSGSQEAPRYVSPEVLKAELQRFATYGYRALVCAKRELSVSQARRYIEKMQEAKGAFINREQLQWEAEEEIEQDFDLLGFTAVEDRIQDGVPETVTTLLSAGIRVWMLTGDSVETALNTAVACQLVSSDMKTYVINQPGADESVLHSLLQSYAEEIEAGQLTESGAKIKGKPFCVLVHGQMLYTLLDEAQPQLGRLFLKIACASQSVLACRLGPAQKGALVELLRSGLEGNPLILAIGDGGNDVAMIQKAHVGVGIMAAEGREAANSADFGIAQFRFLPILLLAHGRWNLRRVAIVISYSFYKNVLLVLPMVGFAPFAAFSGTTLYDPIYLMLYNFVFTSLPIFIAGVFDVDVFARTALAVPGLYMLGIRREYFNYRTLIGWLGRGVVHAAWNYLVMLALFHSAGPMTDGGYSSMGSWSYWACVTVANTTLLFHSTAWMDWQVFVTVCSALVFLVCTAIYSTSLVADLFNPGMVGAGNYMLSQPASWLGLLILLMLSLGADFCLRSLRKAFRPNLVDLLSQDVKPLSAPRKPRKVAAAPGPSVIGAVRAPPPEQAWVGIAPSQPSQRNASCPSVPIREEPNESRELRTWVEVVAKQVTVAPQPWWAGRSCVSHQRREAAEQEDRQRLQDWLKILPPVQPRDHKVVSTTPPPGRQATIKGQEPLPGGRTGTWNILQVGRNMTEGVWHDRGADWRSKLEGFLKKAWEFQFWPILSAQELQMLESRGELEVFGQINQRRASARPLNGIAPGPGRRHGAGHGSQASVVAAGSGVGGSSLGGFFSSELAQNISFIADREAVAAPPPEALAPQAQEAAGALSPSPNLGMGRIRFRYSILTLMFKLREQEVAFCKGLHVLIIVLFRALNRVYASGCIVDFLQYLVSGAAIGRWVELGCAFVSLIVADLFLVWPPTFFEKHWEVMMTAYGVVMILLTHLAHSPVGDFTILIFCLGGPIFVACGFRVRLRYQVFLLSWLILLTILRFVILPDLLWPERGPGTGEFARSGHGLLLPEYIALQAEMALLALTIGYQSELFFRRSFAVNHLLSTMRRTDNELLCSMYPDEVATHVVQQFQHAAVQRGWQRRRQPLTAPQLYLDRGIVTVLFCDICEFEHLVSRLTPIQLVHLLDSAFRMFDRTCEEYDVTKIETVGKTYMAAGMPKAEKSSNPLEDPVKIHAASTVLAAVGILRRMRRSAVGVEEGKVPVCIGIHTGPVISGVVGSLKPQFALFGDTVNTAARMQSTGEINHVQVSASTFAKLEGDGRFTWQQRQVEAKGKGTMNTYLLVHHQRNLDQGRRRRSNVMATLEGLQTPKDLTPLSPSAPSDNTPTPSHHPASPSTYMMSHGPSDPTPSRSQGGRPAQEPPPLTPNMGRNRLGALREVTEARDGILTQNGFEAKEDVIIPGWQKWQDTVAAWARLAWSELTSRIADVVRKKEFDTAHFGARACIAFTCIWFQALSTLFICLGRWNRKPMIFILIRCSYLSFAFLEASYELYFRVSRGMTRWKELSLLVVAGMQVCLMTANLVCLDVQVRSWWSFCESMVMSSALIQLMTLEPTWVSTILAFGSCVATCVVAGDAPTRQTAFFIPMIIQFYSSWTVRSAHGLATNALLSMREEHSQIQELLNSLVPSEVLTELKSGHLSLAYSYKNMSMLFADIVGFTAYCASHTPQEAVNLVTRLFADFDWITGKLGLYKVCTIGDAYVAVNEPTSTIRNDLDFERECSQILKLASMMIADINFAREEVQHSTLDMRIGIHHGSFVGGIIGTGRLRFDIWGEDVMIGNKIESNGKPGVICVSEEAKAVIERFEPNGYTFSQITQIALKSGREVRSFLTMSADGCDWGMKGMEGFNSIEGGGEMFLGLGRSPSIPQRGMSMVPAHVNPRRSSSMLARPSIVINAAPPPVSTKNRR